MGWANASYFKAVKAEAGKHVRTGKGALCWLSQHDALPDEARSALRRYSASWAPRIEDGKALNAALLSDDGRHDRWASALDEAFVWSFRKDVVLWRGGVLPDGRSACFTSASLVERSARQFRSRRGDGHPGPGRVAGRGAGSGLGHRRRQPDAGRCHQGSRDRPAKGH